LFHRVDSLAASVRFRSVETDATIVAIEGIDARRTCAPTLEGGNRAQHSQTVERTGNTAGMDIVNTGGKGRGGFRARWATPVFSLCNVPGPVGRRAGSGDPRPVPGRAVSLPPDSLAMLRASSTSPIGPAIQAENDGLYSVKWNSWVRGRR
jgi:hypothetical protein